MKYLILVKHSLPQIIENVSAREWHLSDEGRTRATLLARRLEFYQPEVIVCSTEPKAIETAEIVASFLKLPVHVAGNLHEHDRSNAAYRTRSEFVEAVQGFFNKPDELVFGNETADQAHQRFSRTVYKLLKKYRNETVVVVAHGTVISLFVSRLKGLSEFSLWNELGLPSFVVLDMQSETMIAKENISCIK
jgi:broad specificity phosphatase PhoE